MAIESGTVYWITGLAGAGKTTVGQLVVESLRTTRAVVWLDGDKLRQVFGNDLGYTLEDRHKGAWRYGRLCKLIAEQGIDVVCCTIAMFHDVRAWNKDNIDSYKEIYLEVPFSVLQQRDQKGLYSSALSGKTTEVVGIDDDVQLPREPYMKIINDGRYTPEQVAAMIIKGRD